MIKHLNEKKSGFTLIEIMVAVSIFVIVAFIVSTTLLAILDASRRANKIRLIVDNMNFALDSMSFKMKFGTSYNLSGNTFSFIDRDNVLISYCQAGSVGFGVIMKCPGSSCGAGVSDCQSITTPEVNVTELIFQESDCGSGTCLNQQFVMLVKADTSVKNSVINLEFQTSVAQY